MKYQGAIAHAVFLLSILALMVFIVIKCFKKKKPDNNLPLHKVKSMEKGIASLHNAAMSPIMESGRQRPSLNGVRRGGGSGSGGNKLPFSWADNPSLVTDAVETGWVRFAFTLSPSVKPTSLLTMSAAGESSNNAMEIDISWEIGHGAVDFMQKIRLNPGIKSSWFRSNPNSCAVSAIRTALPLPGPACAFPQEAYFEIIMLSCRKEDEEEYIKIRDGERMKLINENENGEHNMSNAIISATSAKEDGCSSLGGLLVAVGLTVGGPLHMKLPGSYQGSIGFVSNGSLHHDGNKVVSDCDEGDWGQLTGKVIGCGYDPLQKKVLYTIDGELVHTVTCTTEEFSAPLYPIIAANCDIMVLVNNGQSPFKYSPANVTRSANPCFLGNASQEGALSEDSKEFFSIGNVDSQWRRHSGSRGSGFAGKHQKNRVKNFDEESDVDELFDIILEGKVHPLAL